jgi:uncharacterized protein (TIGR02145 family)
MAIPDSNTGWSLQDVINEVNPATNDLIACFAAANPDYFNPLYEGNKDNLLNFRDYGQKKVAVYGYLYNWYAASHANFAPTGWHVPTDDEWNILINYLGGSDIAGGKLKETGTTHWLSPNTGATNESGFTALPGGYRLGDGSFRYIDYHGYWWSATENVTYYAFNQVMYYNNSSVYRNYDNKELGFSVRLVKDSTALSNGETSTMIDEDGNVYDTICIGTQEWIVQNWKCTKLNDGTPLTKITNDTVWANAGTGDLYYCAYNNDESYV